MSRVFYHTCIFVLWLNKANKCDKNSMEILLPVSKVCNEHDVLQLSSSTFIFISFMMPVKQITKRPSCDVINIVVYFKLGFYRDADLCTCCFTGAENGINVEACPVQFDWSGLSVIGAEGDLIQLRRIKKTWSVSWWAFRSLITQHDDNSIANFISAREIVSLQRDPLSVSNGGYIILKWSLSCAEEEIEGRRGLEKEEGGKRSKPVSSLSVGSKMAL